MRQYKIVTEWDTGREVVEGNKKMDGFKLSDYI